MAVTATLTTTTAMRAATRAEVARIMEIAKETMAAIAMRDITTMETGITEVAVEAIKNKSVVQAKACRLYHLRVSSE